MTIICAVDQDWNIGYQGDMLCHITEDLKRFKQLTTGNIIIMGRKTLESLPQGQALAGRTNIILSKNKAYTREDTLVVHSLEALFELLGKINPRGKQINYLIGGGEIISQLLPHCTQAQITKIHTTFQKADTSIPNLDQEAGWAIMKVGEEFTEKDLTYNYLTYSRI